MTETTKEELIKRSEEVIDFLTEKSKEAQAAGIEQTGNFYTTVAFTLGTLIAWDLKPSGYGPMLGAMLESLTDGMQAGAEAKGVNGTFIKIVRD